MSIVSNIHDVVDFDSKKSAPFNGQRLVKIIYRSRDGKETKQSKCVSVPQITIPEAIVNSNLAAIVLEALHSYQDKIIKSLIDAGATQIHDDQISIDSIVAYQSEESSGGRLTKELIENWFDSSVSEMLIVAIAEKLGVGDSITEAEEVRILSAVAGYKSKFASLAGGKTFYAPEVVGNLQKALQLSESDEISVKLNARLESMKNVQKVDLLDL